MAKAWKVAVLSLDAVFCGVYLALPTNSTWQLTLALLAVLILVICLAGLYALIFPQKKIDKDREEPLRVEEL